MPALKESHIVRIAVEFENQIPQLIKFDRRQPLTGQLIDCVFNYSTHPLPGYVFRINFRRNNSNHLQQLERHRSGKLCTTIL